MYRALGISYQWEPSFLYGEEQLRHARAAGFTSLELSTGENVGVADMARLAARVGMRISAVRLAEDPANRLWRAETDERVLLSYFNGVLREMDGIGTDILILRPAVGKAPPVRQFALDRLSRMAEAAEARGIRIAFENDAVGEHFIDTVRSLCVGYHGVCFDPVSAYLHSGTASLPDFCRPHLLALALGDTDGERRLLPFDGGVSLAPIVADLAAIRYRGVLSLRADGGHYAALGYDGFAVRAYNAMHRLSLLLDDAEGVI